MAQSISSNNVQTVQSISIVSEMYANKAKEYAEQAAESANAVNVQASVIRTYLEQARGYAELAEIHEQNARIYAQQAQEAALSYGGYARFCVNSGRVNANGEPDFITQSNNEITLLAPFVYTTANGVTYEVTTNITHSLSGYTNGNYNIFVNHDSGTFETILLNNHIYIQNTEPNNPLADDIWVNTAVYPRLAYIYTLTNGWLTTNYVPVGSTTIQNATPVGDNIGSEDVPTI